MPDSRSEFEKWAEANDLSALAGIKTPYAYQDTNSAWRGWQAREASLMARIPVEPRAEVVVGDFILSKGVSPGRVWIARDSGEGGDFKTSDLEAMIRDFYNENF